jgi:hypothetical protein
VEGYGSVTETWVRDHLPAQARFSIRPVLDIPGLAPVDSYEIPERHRRAVQIMTPADIFPFSSALGEGHQIDHTERFEHGRAAVGAGQSRVGNYGPMSTPHHRLKTFGRWTAKQPFRASTSGETPTAPCISSITPALVLWAELPDDADPRHTPVGWRPLGPTSPSSVLRLGQHRAESHGRTEGRTPVVVAVVLVGGLLAMNLLPFLVGLISA